MPPTPTQPLVLTFEDARRAVEDHASQIAPDRNESVALLHAAGRVLAEPITADRDIPPFPRSTRDGYALRAADFGNVARQVKSNRRNQSRPHSSRIHTRSRPGVFDHDGRTSPAWRGRRRDGGIHIPAGRFRRNNKERRPWRKHRPSGSRGQTRQPPARPEAARLNEADIALAASVGKSQLLVFVRPRVAVLTTGDEIVEVDAEPGPTQIRNSNTYSLAVQIQKAGGDTVLLPIAPDEPNHLRQLIEEGLQSDLLIMTGGVSMGRYDLVEQALAELQAEFFFTGSQDPAWKAGSIRPSSALVWGRATAPAQGRRAPDSNQDPSKYFFGLPGNPVSTMVTFELFARPVLEALSGMSPRPLTFVHARLKSDIRIKTGLTRFPPAVLSGKYADSHAEPVPWQGSGDMAARSRANCYIVIPPDREHLLAGEWVAVMMP